MAISSRGPMKAFSPSVSLHKLDVGTPRLIIGEKDACFKNPGTGAANPESIEEKLVRGHYLSGLDQSICGVGSSSGTIQSGDDGPAGWDALRAGWIGR